jgi:DNA processing protein
VSPLLADPGDLFAADPPAYREAEGTTFADEDLWDELDLFGPAPVLALEEEAEAPPACEDDRTALVRLLGPSPVAFDDLARQSALPPRLVRTLLVDLELAGLLVVMPGGLVALRA